MTTVYHPRMVLSKGARRAARARYTRRSQPTTMMILAPLRAHGVAWWLMVDVQTTPEEADEASSNQRRVVYYLLVITVLESGVCIPGLSQYVFRHSCRPFILPMLVPHSMQRLSGESAAAGWDTTSSSSPEPYSGSTNTRFAILTAIRVPRFHFLFMWSGLGGGVGRQVPTTTSIDTRTESGNFHQHTSTFIDVRSYIYIYILTAIA